jgi:hypothetical protein
VQNARRFHPNTETTPTARHFHLDSERTPIVRLFHLDSERTPTARRFHLNSERTPIVRFSSSDEFGFDSTEKIEKSAPNAASSWLRKSPLRSDFQLLSINKEKTPESEVLIVDRASTAKSSRLPRGKRQHGVVRPTAAREASAADRGQA